MTIFVDSKFTTRFRTTEGTSLTTAESASLAFVPVPCTLVGVTTNWYVAPSSRLLIVAEVVDDVAVPPVLVAALVLE